MSVTNVVRAVVKLGSNYTVTAPIVKEDYGLYLKIEGVELPSTYEVDFSNSENNGTSVTMIGNSDGVLIPRQFIDSGKDVLAFLYHVGADFGRTVYKFRIPNKVRPDRTDETPTPEEQSVIDQTINALNAAVEKTAQDAQTTTTNAAEAQRHAEEADQSAQDAEDSKTAAETADRAADRAVAAKLAAADSEANAAEHERQAGTQAGAARSAADTAADKATQAAQSASEASVQNTAAQTAKTGAETARAGSESARDEAVAANTSAQQSETAVRELLEEYSDVATEATAQEILQREEDGLALMEFALRALDNRLDTMVEDLPHDTTGQQLAEALNFGNSMLNALYNELANEEV